MKGILLYIVTILSSAVQWAVVSVVDVLAPSPWSCCCVSSAGGAAGALFLIGSPAAPPALHVVRSGGVMSEPRGARTEAVLAAHIPSAEQYYVIRV